VLLEQLRVVMAFAAHGIKGRQRLLILHLEGLALPILDDELEVFVIKLFVQGFHIILQIFDSLFKSLSIENILMGL